MRIPIKAGEEHPCAKFSQDEANEIRQRFEEDPRPTLRGVADELGVSHRTVYKIVHGISYSE